MSDICQRLYRDLRHLSRSSVCNFIQQDTPTQMTYISHFHNVYLPQTSRKFPGNLVLLFKIFTTPSLILI